MYLIQRGTRFRSLWFWCPRCWSACCQWWDARCLRRGACWFARYDLWTGLLNRTRRTVERVRKCRRRPRTEGAVNAWKHSQNIYFTRTSIFKSVEFNLTGVQRLWCCSSDWGRCTANSRASQWCFQRIGALSPSHRSSRAQWGADTLRTADTHLRETRWRH